MGKKRETGGKSKAVRNASGSQGASASACQGFGAPCPAGASGSRQPARRTASAADGVPTCPVEGKCGGCKHLGVPYADQLAEKDARVAALFAEFVNAGAQLRPILGMEDPYRYRDKVTSPFAPDKSSARGGLQQGKRQHGKPGGGAGRGVRRDGRYGAPLAGSGVLTGMYAAGSHAIVPTDDCLLENAQAQQVIRAVKGIMLKHGMAPYDEDRGVGFMRHAVVRVGHESGEVLVTLVTNDDEFPNSKPFCRELVRRCPFVTTVVQNVNTRQTNVILGQEERRLYGPGFILDTLCGLSFRISSQSFYQVNSTQTAVLYETAMDLARIDGATVAIDAYCGTGTIGLVAASRGAARVAGVDSVEAAIRDARLNARHNGIGNARFVAADAGEFMREAAMRGEGADVVFMDPPRAGSTEQFLESLAVLAPERVVYVSCNPETQVRDMRHLARKGYIAQAVQPVDMFPHTDHVEVVCLLTHI